MKNLFLSNFTRKYVSLLLFSVLFTALPLAAQVTTTYFIPGITDAQTATGVTELTSAADLNSLPRPSTLTTGWYVLEGTFTYNGTITVSGDVNLILEDGCNVTVNGVNAGIEVEGSNSLTIYGQTGTGILTVYGNNGGAGIGGNGFSDPSITGSDAGTITINGGNVKATGGGGAAGTITINGGVIVANGSYAANNQSAGAGAGIGGGGGTEVNPNANTSIGGAGGTIIINGGDITANGGSEANNSGAAGIGGGGGGINSLHTNGGDAGFIRIVDINAVNATGGHLTGSSNFSGAAIGSGGDSNNAQGNEFTDYTPVVDDYITITISQATGGTITAIPNGETTSVTVIKHATQTFTIIPGSGYILTAVTVGGTTVSTSSPYILQSIMSPNTISAVFTASLSAITAVNTDITAPATGGIPNTTATNVGNFSAGTVSWSPGDNPFLASTVYTATVTLTANPGFTFTGLTTATINGQAATVTNNPDGTVDLSYQFPATTAGGGTPITFVSTNVTAPATGGIPNTTATNGAHFTAGTVTWDPNDNPFLVNTEYTATVTLIASANYTFTGLISAEINGQPATVTNNQGSTVDLSYLFPATTAPPVVRTMIAPDMSLAATGGTYDDNNVILTGKVSTAGAAVTPTGTVTFKEGDTTLGALPLDDSGTAVFTIPSVIYPGNYTFTASYSGDDNFYANNATTTVYVTPYLFVSPNELDFIAAGETKTFTVICNTYWTLDNPVSWLTISPGEEEHTMLLTADANPTAVKRFALLEFGIPGIIFKNIEAAQDAAVDKTAIESVGTPTVIVYSQNGDVIVKSDSPIKNVVVYDVSGKAIKAVNGIQGFNGSIAISGLPKQQVLIVKVTTSFGIRNYETTFDVVN